MKLKGLKGFWVWGTKKIYEPGNPNVFQGTDEIKRPKAKGCGGTKKIEALRAEEILTTSF